MSNKDQLNHALKLANQLQETFDELMTLQTRAFSQLKPEERAKIKFVENDLEAMKKAYKKGDESVINQMLQKYAGTTD